MSVASISADVSVPRAGTGPRFRLDPGRDRFAAVEVARDRALLAPEGRGGRERVPGFFGSWQVGPLSPDPEYRLPETVWAELRGSTQLCFRCVTSSRPDAWVDVDASVTDDRVGQAPCLRIVDVSVDLDQVPPERLDELWAAVVRDPEVARLTSDAEAEGAVVRHSSSPRRPFSPRSVVWVVAVVAPAPGGLVTEVVISVREREATETIRRSTSSRRSVGSAGAVSAALGAVDPPLAGALRARPDRFTRRGPVWVWQDNAPAPTEGIGGTVLVSAVTGELLFSGGTSW
jgi:hypothetical protein